MTLKHRSLGLAGVIAVALLSGRLVAHQSKAVGLLALVVVGILAVAAITELLLVSFDDAEGTACVRRWALASLGIHLFVGLVVVNSGTLTRFLGPDAFTYDAVAVAISDHWSHGLGMPDVTAGKEGYYYLLAGIYWVFGHSTWAGVALNAILAALLVPVTADTTRRLFGRAAGRYAPALMVVVPGIVLWTSQLLKEAPFVLLVAVAANCAVRLTDRFSPGPALTLMVVLPLMLAFRSQLGFAVSAGIFAGIVLGRAHVAGGLAGGLAVLALAAGMVSVGVGSSGYDTAVKSTLAQANQARQNSAATSSGVETETDVSTSSRAVSFVPQGLIIVGLGPFPWQLHGARQLIVIPDMIAWWVLMVAFCWGLPAARRRGRQWLTLPIPALAVAVVLGLTIGNFGTVVRERMQVLVLLAPIIALGLAERRTQRDAEAARAVPVAGAGSSAGRRPGSVYSTDPPAVP